MQLRSQSRDWEREFGRPEIRLTVVRFRGMALINSCCIMKLARNISDSEGMGMQQPILSNLPTGALVLFTLFAKNRDSSSRLLDSQPSHHFEQIGVVGNAQRFRGIGDVPMVGFQVL